MKLSNFKFELPAHNIAQYPMHPKEDARLMVLHKDSGQIEHKTLKDLPSYFSEGDTLVANDSKVLPCKLYGYKEKTNAKVEVLLLRKLNNENALWDTIVEPARKIRIGNKIYFGNGELVAEIIDNTTSRGRTLKLLFDGTEEEFYALIDQIGHMPLPNQIERPSTLDDRTYYQTIFAQNIGSIVLPAAGLHFTPYLLKYLELQNISVVSVTLHIGLGELKIIDMEDLTKVKASSERFIITQESADVVNQSIANQKKVCAIGTSVLRAIESSVSVSCKLKANNNWTNKFILPSCSFKICNALLTTFHLPSSISLVSVAAFGGEELVLAAYAEAIDKHYRFFLYGDAMLII
ncbi:tRNA preQ1(34) S-adenosylmethionine ribosyltransferase-isomerase QueA [Candidatus Cardinium hertigii]|uniref:S-adenosylmethionine:tRNA ribosyltransferase-isomerase n=1 Tax=Candidatus Cardinium hertigii TaxID=247481 RepID=A0A3N2QCA9_9BACT|nr:tRNA preQ1(34) S-adenosylmethionine ribosyltransferase-isomerase QueA [Candidatus Cardinium hertigii]ROT47447.1 tRNA preQ1(34) S-adenosylmethionine ribosyltransferase-isomerase QueA [Candidatus Cardinium hertigii]ROT47450.1 tRNA preQ1(34) S-adenosylmethionine ribosyltransferase-isomerase QueA [Candidatus Cardinium hertigii]